MVNVNLEGALPFLGADGPDYAAAERAHRTLFGRSGAGSEFTGWLDLPRRMAVVPLLRHRLTHDALGFISFIPSVSRYFVGE